MSKKDTEKKTAPPVHPAMTHPDPNVARLLASIWKRMSESPLSPEEQEQAAEQEQPEQG